MSLIVSFAWTTDSFLAGRKTRTRRDWKDSYAEMFKPGYFVQAWDRQPRFGGKKIGEIVIVKVWKQNTSQLTEEDYEKEGFAYMEEKGIKMWGKPARQAFDDWKKETKDMWVVDFRKL